jgi:L-amino acid N-acyltransferase YncA
MSQQTTAIVRPSVDADMTAITRIYAHHVLNGTGTFETSPPSEEEMRTRRADVLGKNLPWLVIENNGYIAGFAYANWFKPRPAYRFSVEDSIYLAADALGKGLGKQLLNELLVQLERRGVRKVMAVIGDSANTGSVGVHRSAGFEQAGLIESCGWKFGRWLDIVLMQKSIGEGNTTPPDSTH